MCSVPVCVCSVCVLLHRTNNKTKVIACSRRQKENNTFADIADVLPIQENAKDLDKASILRLVINYLKLRDLLKDGSEEESEGECQGEELHGGDVALSPLDIAVAQLDSSKIVMQMVVSIIVEVS